MEKVFLFFDGFLSDVQLAQELNSMAGTFELAQNYPNPFNPNTKIEFRIKNSGFTTLKVYNALGQLIQVLVEDDLSSGQHEVIFDGSELASGTYIYVLKSGVLSIRRKMLLIK